MPKKQRNAFFFFMKEIQERYSEEGKNISLKVLSAECHPLYKNLTSGEKEKYEQMANDYKNQARDTLEGKLCSDGTVLALNIQTERERWETMENETKAVERMVSEIPSVDEVADKAFYIVCFNVLCCTDDDDYIPNEIGVVKYSIRRGIEECYHCIIDPGCIPLGYTHASKQHSEDTHLIPISGFEQADCNYNRICKQILDIVNPMQNKVAPVFCTEQNLKQNRGCLQWLSFRAGHLDMESIHCYDVTCLMMELRAYVENAFPSRSIALDFLSNHSFDYTANTRCDYHEDLDNAYCALGCAKRTCFILSDALCSLYGVDCTTNHLPPRVDDSIEMEVFQPVFPQSRSFIPPKLPEKYAASNNVSNAYNGLFGNHSEKTVKNLNIDYSRSWMKEFNQPQPDTASSSKNNLPASNSGKPRKSGETRQPSTVPLVLNQGAFPLKPQFAFLGRGRGIGRGKILPID